MTTRWLIRCRRQRLHGRCDFVTEWHATQDTCMAAVAWHQRQHWDSIDWGEVAVPYKTSAVAVGGWNMPARQGELWV
jgi:hypothetical protein